MDDFTLDEAYHIVAGVSYVQRADFRINPEHPPFVKLWVGGVISVLGFQLSPFREIHDKTDERNFVNDDTYLHNDPVVLQHRTRIAMWILNGTLLFLFGFSLRRVFGVAVALGTILFLAIDPTIAAHLPVVMTDLPVALLSATATVLAGRAFRDWRPVDLVLAACALGCALAAKHSAPIFCVVFLLAGTACAFVVPFRKPGDTRIRRVAMLFVTLLVAVLILWSFYGFRFTESSGAQEVFNRPLAEKIADVHSSGYRFALLQLAKHHLLPRAYIWGLADVVRGGLEGRVASRLLFGHPYWGNGPVWAFPADVAVKLPIGLGLLVIAGIVLFLSRRCPPQWKVPGFLLLVAVAAFFFFVLSRGATYGGIRHALPAVLLLSVFAGFAVHFSTTSSSALPKMGVIVAFLAAAISALPVLRPWEYYNELVGGKDRAYLSFNDEGIDIFQRSKEVARYYHEVLEPAGEIPLLEYLPYDQEANFLKLDWIGRDQKRDAHHFDNPVFSGTVMVGARSLGPRLFSDWAGLRGANPVARFGNLMVFRGNLDVGPILADNLYWMGLEKLYGKTPDLAEAEHLFRRSSDLDPSGFWVFINLGNIYLIRDSREEAARAYEDARAHAPAGTIFRRDIEEQLRLLSTHPLAEVRPLRDPRME